MVLKISVFPIAQLIIVDRASEAIPSVSVAIAPNLIKDDTLIALVPTLGGPKGVKFGDIKSLILQSIPTPPPTPTKRIAGRLGAASL